MKHTQHQNDFMQAVRSWINQKPSLEYANYGCPKACRAEYTAIQRDKKHAEYMLSVVNDYAFSMEDIESAMSAFSGRLSLDIKEGRIIGFNYCTGQYWPTEYRKAACAVMAQLLWDAWRAEFKDSEHVGNAIRKQARAVFGRTIANAWFN